MSAIIQVDRLGKKFRRGARPAYGRFSELLANTARAGGRWVCERAARMFRGGQPAAELGDHEFWALNDVSFEVQQGEVLGIIGRNGAGKSTLLKLLSRISEPTSGEIRLRGRVGSLLEVGTGFHPELTGRENVYLNGTILGMRKREIDRRFDEIVAFAEIEPFLDTPVKHYSSGMYMRLAFAVAAHLEPEILIVDEVLAVGDAAFQKKCLGKMGEVARCGRTVLFVSHNMQAISDLCSSGLVLQNGHIACAGNPRTCIDHFAGFGRVASTSGFTVDLREAALREKARPSRVTVQARGKQPCEPILFDDEIVASIEFSGEVAPRCTFAFQVLTPTGMHIFNSFYTDRHENPPLASATREVAVIIPRKFLPGGLYEAVFAYTYSNAEVVWLTRDTWFEIDESVSGRNKALPVQRTGIVSVELAWTASTTPWTQ